jgi:hypothetical protein
MVVLSQVARANPSDGLLSGEPEQPLEKAVLSGPSGEFHFDGLRAGQYECFAIHPEFMPPAQGPESTPLVVLPSSPERDFVQLKLAPFGAIQGKLVNQFGEPLENFVVVISAAVTSDGERVMYPAGAPWTNDSGDFVLTRLAPGKYYVRAAGRQGGTETHVGPDQAHYAPWESFAPVYFGGAPDMASAVPIQVDAGSVVRADFHLNVQPAFRIRGRIEGYQPSASVDFELLHGKEPGRPHRAVLDGATGEFVILDVLPGSYTLRVTQPNMYGDLPVTVTRSDLDGISISFSPLMEITGSVQPTGAQSPAPRGLAPGCAVSLREHLSFGFELGRPVADGPFIPGSFHIPGVLPGEYRVGIQCFGGYPVLASFGDINLLTDPIVTISPGAPPPIDVEYQPGGGTLKARFAGDNPPEGTVLLVPVSLASAGPWLKNLRSPNECTLANLPPGDYSVYGLADSQDVEFRNPAFIQSLSGGIGVHIEDGKTTEVTIDKISK